MSAYRKHHTGISSISDYESMRHQRAIQKIYDHLIEQCSQELLGALYKGRKGRLGKYYLHKHHSLRDKHRIRAILALIPLLVIGKNIDIYFKDVLWLAKNCLM